MATISAVAVTQNSALLRALRSFTRHDKRSSVEFPGASQETIERMANAATSASTDATADLSEQVQSVVEAAIAEEPADSAASQIANASPESLAGAVGLAYDTKKFFRSAG